MKTWVVEGWGPKVAERLGYVLRKPNLQSMQVPQDPLRS